MDIYSFIPSRDIAEHCRTIGHEFTPLEIAVIIYHSKKNLAERHKAWQEIINTMPDTKVIEWAESKRKQKLYDSLHQFLQDYMRVEKGLAEGLKGIEPNAIYTYMKRYFSLDGSPVYTHNRIPYSTFDKAIGAVKKAHDTKRENCEIDKEAFYVYKRYIDEEKHLSVQVELNGEIISSWVIEGGIIAGADDELFSAIAEISIYIPVPFCKGDILTYGYNAPFVLTDEAWKYGEKHCPDGHQYLAEGSIMDSVNGYTLRFNNQIYWDFNPASLDLEYFRGELTGLNRTLKAVSNHLKGEITADLMMNAYNVFLHEEKEKELLCRTWYTDEGLALVGLEKQSGNDSR